MEAVQLYVAALRLRRTVTEGLGDRRPKTLVDEAVKVRCRLPDIDDAQVPSMSAEPWASSPSGQSAGKFSASHTRS